ncbi:flagellar protein FlgN [Clostridium algoriphilum]|uniref:flagellar protein FlgN n=1 Tax=Clostridium algoriphilum TaxID=198347 RepID=UPI001CF199CB|nr:flagellar protein FlgN [Clostridium algoriphilum]MCB2294279.1 flagellar protein FlgN [Clostridium algoriphilum]
MIEELNMVMVQETDTLKNLLLELEEQHRCIIVNDIFGLESCVNKVKIANKNIAYMEVERRKLTENRPMMEIIDEAKDAELLNNYHKIKQLLHEVVLQKDTNELLLRQGLSFTNRILNVLNPAKETATYNSYGKVKNSMR